MGGGSGQLSLLKNTTVLVLAVKGAYLNSEADQTHVHFADDFEASVFANQGLEVLGHLDLLLKRRRRFKRKHSGNIRL